MLRRCGVQLLCLRQPNVNDEPDAVRYSRCVAETGARLKKRCLIPSLEHGNRCYREFIAEDDCDEGWEFGSFDFYALYRKNGPPPEPPDHWACNGPPPTGSSGGALAFGAHAGHHTCISPLLEGITSVNGVPSHACGLWTGALSTTAEQQAGRRRSTTASARGCIWPASTLQRRAGLWLLHGSSEYIHTLSSEQENELVLNLCDKVALRYHLPSQRRA